jgi:hypothetical protein
MLLIPDIFSYGANFKIYIGSFISINPEGGNYVWSGSRFLG